MKVTDKYNRKIKERDIVEYEYQKGKYSLFVLIKDEKGILRFHFPGGDGEDMEGKTRTDAWYEKTDKNISKVIGYWSQ